MIGALTGTIAEVRPSGSVGEIEIDVGGVGYLVLVPSSLLANLRVGETIRLTTHMVVREDSMTLYGFSEPERRQMFMNLLSVSGVGPKLALAILSAMDPPSLARAVASGDVSALTTVPGVGKRSAERMILELKEKLGGPAEIALGSGSKLTEVRDALIGLGYSPAEAREALDHIGANSSDASVEDLVRAALKELSRV